jgi:hypothetical protein
MKGIFLATLVAAELTAVGSAATIDQNWESRFVRAPGLDGAVYAMLAVGTNLYVGGAFTTTGISNTAGVARWDGNSWSSVGGGINGNVLALATDGTNIYAGGWFDSAGGDGTTNIAKWDGTNWSSIGALSLPGAPSPSMAAVFCLAFDEGDLFVGGFFYNAGGTLATNVARWDGQNWHAIGAGLGAAGGFDEAAVMSLAFYNSNLYAAGRFPSSGSGTMTNIARWNGDSWEEVGGGISGGRIGIVWMNGTEFFGTGSTLCSTASGLLVGGDFTKAGAQSLTNLALWNGTNWSSVGGGSDQPIARIISDGNNQIGLGSFSHIGGIATEGVALLSGSNWSPLGSGVSSVGLAAARIGSKLYIGGDFQIAGGQSAGFIADWDGTNWQPLMVGEATAPSDTVGSLTFGSDGQLYAAGGFQTAGKTRVNGVARYDGANWFGFGNGFPERNIHSVAVVGTNVYVKGYFSRPASGIRNLARWNGSDWVSLGLGLDNDGYDPTINSLAAGISNLFVAGNFKTAGGISVTNLARWDGEQWHSLNYYPSPYYSFTSVSSIDALATRDDDLFIGERTDTYVGESSFILRVKSWQDGDWTQVGGSIQFATPPSISSMVWVGTNLYVTGNFIATNGFFATNALCWNGVTWAGVNHPFGADSLISPATTDGTNLFVAINSYGAPLAEVKLAKWNGTQWKTLGTGVTSARPWGGVYGLAVRGRDLYVGGEFTSAGGKPADNLALWHDFPAVTLSGRGWQPNGRFGLSVSGGKDQLVQLQTSTNLQTWTSQGAILPNSEPYLFDDVNSSTNPARFYRLLLVP